MAEAKHKQIAKTDALTPIFISVPAGLRVCRKTLCLVLGRFGFRSRVCPFSNSKAGESADDDIFP